jgi:hypothetical protein
MKSNKERKKAEKQKQKQKELEQQLQQQQSQQLSLDNCNDAEKNERPTSIEIHTTSQPDLFTDEHPLSKSSPDVIKAALYDDQNRLDEMRSEISLRSNMNDVVIKDHISSRLQEPLGSTSNGLDFYVEEKPNALGDNFAQSSGLMSTHSFSSPSLHSLEHLSEKPSRYTLGHHQARLPVSPMQITGINQCGGSGLDQEERWDPARLRRQASLPASGDNKLSRLRSSKRICPDMARLMRDRVHVVSYMQRKASDASSIGSLNTRDATTRRSNDSSESSHVNECTRKSSTGSHLRKNSFSFFEKLSLDVESSIGDLQSQSDEDNEQ